MEFVGWYTTGDVPSSEDVNLHEQVSISMNIFIVWEDNGRLVLKIMHNQRHLLILA